MHWRPVDPKPVRLWDGTWSCRSSYGHMLAACSSPGQKCGSQLQPHLHSQTLSHPNFISCPRSCTRRTVADYPRAVNVYVVGESAVTRALGYAFVPGSDVYPRCVRKYSVARCCGLDMCTCPRIVAGAWAVDVAEAEAAAAAAALTVDLSIRTGNLERACGFPHTWAPSTSSSFALGKQGRAWALRVCYGPP